MATWSTFVCRLSRFILNVWLMDSNLSEIFDNPARRRFWLLIKALERAPLREALALAKGTEAFLMGCDGASQSQERAVAHHSIGTQLPTSIH
jgi:hypothetical protein